MGALEHVFKLPQNLMLCKPNRFYGKILYNSAIAEGDFGVKRSYNEHKVLKRWFRDRIHNLCKIPLAPRYIICKKLKYWRWTITRIPERIRRRKFVVG